MDMAASRIFKKEVYFIMIIDSVGLSPVAMNCKGLKVNKLINMNLAIEDYAIDIMLVSQNAAIKDSLTHLL